MHTRTWVNLKIIRLRGKKRFKKEHILYASIYVKLMKMKTSERKQISGLWLAMERKVGEIESRHQETFGDGRCVS